jgi:integrase
MEQQEPRRTAWLTDKAVRSLKPQPGKRVERFDGAVPGLSIRVAESGAKSWTLNYREHIKSEDGGWTAGRRLRRWTIGPFPTVSLASARKKAQTALTHLKDRGIDPAATTRAARNAETFGELVESYLKVAKQPPPVGKRSWQEDQRILNKIFLPDWKHRAAKDITRRDVRAVIEDVASSAPVAANRALACVRTVFNFALKRDWLLANPAALIEMQEETPRDRVLTDDEIRELWAALDAAKVLKRVDDDEPAPAISPMIARGLQVLLLTGQRPGEVFGMGWRDVDRDSAVWTIPMTKNGVAHRVPLVPEVLKLLDEAQADAPSDNQFVFAGERGASVEARAKKAMAALKRAKAISFDAHRHDLRRTAATNMEAAGVQPFIIAKVLNHTVRDVGRVTQVYTRHPYDVEKRTALETWSRRLDAILEAKDSSRVLPFAR